MEGPRLSALNLVVIICALGTTSATSGGGYSNASEHVEYPPYDGWFNNAAHPDYGGAERPMFRRVAPRYHDGVYEPRGEDQGRPNPIELSDNFLSGSTGHPSVFNRTAFLVFFGQQVVEEILDAQRPGCPPEYFNIRIPKGHAQYDPDNKGDRQMPFLRSRYDMRTGFSPNNPRQQLNEISPYIDGTLFYGPNKAWTDAIRKFEGGLLAATNDSVPSKGYYPIENTIRLPFANPPPPRDHPEIPLVSRFHRIGNPRGNENPFLLTFGVLWFRYHNLKARQINASHPDWTDEKIFLEARKWTVAVYQKIVTKDWLPSWLNGPKGDQSCAMYNFTDLGDYHEKGGYDGSIDPQISHLFQTSAMRFGHTLVPPGVYRRRQTGSRNNCQFRNESMVKGFEGHKRALRTCNTYWRSPDLVTENGIDEIILGMSSQITEREDTIITPDLRGFVFGPLEFNRRDLMAVNIQRGRDHGLPDYNTARKAMGLEPITDFQQINPNLTDGDPEVFNRMRNLYRNGVDDIDVFVGGMLETTRCGPGPLFRKIILDQFHRIRHGDRFWYENYKQNHLFTEAEVMEIEKVRIRDVVLAVTEITEDEIQDNPFFFNPDVDPCPPPAQLNGSDPTLLEPCTAQMTFDYFHGSEVAYVLSFLALGLVLVACIAALFLLVKLRQKKDRTRRKSERQKTIRQSKNASLNFLEEVVEKGNTREVVLKIDDEKRKLVVRHGGKTVRILDMQLVMLSETKKVTMIMSTDKGNWLLLIRIPKEYDLILQFDELVEREQFRQKLVTFLEGCGVAHETMEMTGTQLMKEAITKQARKKLLDKFFRAIFAHAFKYESDRDELKSMSTKEAQRILNIELTKEEFADAMAMKPNSLFVENMFTMVDVDRSGYVSFREFLDMIVIFAKGDAEAKARLLFDMYDVGQNGILEIKDFENMLRSMMELAGQELDKPKMDELVNTMLHHAGLAGKKELRFDDFQLLLNDYKNELNYATLQFDGTGLKVPEKALKRQSLANRAVSIHQAYFSEQDEIYSPITVGQQRPDTSKAKRRTTLDIDAIKKTEYPQSKAAKNWKALIRYIENYRLHIFWLVLYTLVTIGIFAERAYYYSVEREHAGLRRIAGYGVTVTRGAASGMMFTYSCLLVTMCRNTITFLRETFLHRYIPFDANIAMHKYIAAWALGFTLMHIIGHSINFYHISTQTANDLICLFRDFHHATHELPKFYRWCWQTITGFTGVLLTILTFIMYTFAVQYARRYVYKAFWFTHNLYPIFFILTVMHGSGNLVQPPFFHYFFLGPVVLFALDRLVSVSRKKVEIPVVRAELLPSAVMMLEFKRPVNFEYKSGQWVRIACLGQSKDEYHPFTLTSAPHEENLMLHIRSVGPWTNNLRKLYDPINLKQHPYHKLYLDGPYGEGHQDWYKFDVAVLVGGGIGVTPFASILKDLVQKSKVGTKFPCKKVYFLWVTRTQKHFEWMTDNIREVEENDPNDLVAVHIFITQFKQKFDLRTTMLYICERHFQKISNRSLFTGLRSITHFGRPNFPQFLEALTKEHPEVRRFGVFSCGPPPMTHNVESACARMNRVDGPAFQHHFENF